MAAAGAFLLDPDHAVAAGGCLRPVALHALSHALDALLASAASSANDRPARAGGASETPPKRKGKTGAGARVDEAVDAVATRHERVRGARDAPRAPPARQAHRGAIPPLHSATLRATGRRRAGRRRRDALRCRRPPPLRARVLSSWCARAFVCSASSPATVSAAPPPPSPRARPPTTPTPTPSQPPPSRPLPTRAVSLTGISPRSCGSSATRTPRSAGPSPWRSSEHSVFPPRLPRDSARDRPPPQSSATPSPRRGRRSTRLSRSSEPPRF